MKDAKTIRDVALFIIDGHTISETSKKFRLSERTIQNYIKELNKKDSPFYNEKLYNAVRFSQNKMVSEKVKIGGKIGKRGPSNSEFDMEEIARVMIEERISLNVASKFFGVPASTIYEGLKRIDDEELQAELRQLYDDNKEHNKFNGATHFK